MSSISEIFTKFSKMMSIRNEQDKQQNLGDTHVLQGLANELFDTMLSPPAWKTSRECPTPEEIKFKIKSKSASRVMDIMEKLGFDKFEIRNPGEGENNQIVTLKQQENVMLLLSWSLQSTSPNAKELSEHAIKAECPPPQSKLDNLSQAFGFLGTLSPNDQPEFRSKRLIQKLTASGHINDMTSITDIANFVLENCEIIPALNKNSRTIELRVNARTASGVSKILEAADIWQPPLPQHTTADLPTHKSYIPMIPTVIDTRNMPRSIWLSAPEEVRDLMALATCATSGKAKENARFLLQYSKKYSQAAPTPHRPSISTLISDQEYRR